MLSQVPKKERESVEIKPYIRKVHYYETDLMGIIHHSNYIRWFEESRVDFMEQMGYGYDKMEQNGVSAAVLSVSCEYKAMVRFGETVKIKCAIVSLKPSRMTIRYQVLNHTTGELCTTGESSHCFISNAKGRSVALKKELPGLYTLLEQHLEPSFSI